VSSLDIVEGASLYYPFLGNDITPSEFSNNLLLPRFLYEIYKRFYPTSSPFADRNGNTRPGTVVDKGVTDV
jgi:hypothetical protein